jgi:hypothetical protein
MVEAAQIFVNALSFLNVENKNQYMLGPLERIEIIPVFPEPQPTMNYPVNTTPRRRNTPRNKETAQCH